MSQGYYGGGGGGFVTGSPFNGGGSTQSSPGGGISRSETAQSTRPLTLAQCNKATQTHTESEYKLNGINIGHVTVVAQIIGITRNTTNCVYFLEDGTSSMEARAWVDSNSQPAEGEESAPSNDGPQPNTFVRVTGNLKAFGSKRYINATSVRPVSDQMEVYYHSLDVIASGLMVERGPPNGQANTNNANANAGASSSTYAPQQSTASGPYAEMEPMERSIMTYISSADSGEGVNVTEIARHLGGGPEAAIVISGALERLMDSGYVFTTKDEAHFSVSA